MTSNLSARIHTKRKRLRITIEELAGIANVGRRFVIDLEKGRADVDGTQAQRVMLALGLQNSNRKKDAHGNKSGTQTDQA